MHRFWFWAPRGLAIAFALFTSIFALDVFGEQHGVWRTALALLLHLLPTALVFALLAIAWRWERTGALLFTCLGILYCVVMRSRFPWPVYAAIAGPLVLTGALFLVSARRSAALVRHR